MRHMRWLGHVQQAAELRATLPTPKQLLLETAAEKGVSSWLSAIPALNKSDFRDAVCIHYGLSLDGESCVCVCGPAMTIGHALTCPAGGYPTARHNEIRDVLADTIGKVLPDVEVESVLLPFEGKTLPCRTAYRSLEARLDIRAQGFWMRQQHASFDVRNRPKATLQSRTDTLRQLKTHEQ
eukprot:scpid91769/ scgid25728/ 